MGWTSEELAEMAAADAEIEASFRLLPEDMERAREQDRLARFEDLLPARRKVAAYQKAYYEANREKLAAYQKAYYEANREKLAAQQKAYREANREKYNKYMREYMRKRRENHG